MTLIFKKSSAQPEFTVGAAITGTVQVGQTLSCTYTVTKARANNVTVRWYSYFDAFGTDQVLIGTGTTYVLTGNELGRYIRTIVTASNPAGAVQSTSSYTAAVTTEVPPDPPAVTSAAAITGTLEVGQTLTVSVTFSGATSTTYQWYSYTSAGGADASALGTSTTQALTVAEDGKYIGCQATGTNASGSTVSTATLVGPVAANASEVPTVVSAATIALDDGADGYNEGEYLICDAEFSGHTATPTFTWYKCDAGKANPEELVGAGETAILPLPVSEPNAYRGALFLSTSLGLYENGKYVYCVATAVNGVGSTPSESAAVGPFGPIQGTGLTQADLGAAPAPPKYLNIAGAKYYLAEDVSFSGSGFVFLKSNQTLNLNGKTITYDNATPVFTYGDFESGATGWDWSTTGNPGGGVDTQGTGTYAEIYTTADFTTDYNARRINDGTKSLRFTNAACSQGGVESYIKTSTLTLTTDVWYCFSMQCSYNGDSPAVPFIRVRDSEGNLIYSRTTANKPTTKSPYMYYIDGMFKAVATPANYVLEVGVTGTAGAAGTVYIDDVRLCRARVAGIYIEPYTLNGDYSGTTRQPTPGTPPWDVTTLTSGVTGCKVKNGSLTQGQNGSQWCASIVQDRLGVHAAHRLTCTVHGPNSTHGKDAGPDGGFGTTLSDCVLISNGLVSGHRDNNWGSAIYSRASSVTRCRFYNHTITAINSLTGQTYKGNYFYGKARWTNARAIAGTGINVTVHDNVVDNTGDYYGRGFGFGVSSGTLNVYNNIVRCVPSSLNQEYSGFDSLGFGDHVIQIEGMDIGAVANIYGNVVEGYASYDPDAGGDPCLVNVLRINGIGVGATLNIHGNTIRAIATNGGYAFAVASGYDLAYQGTYGTVLLQDNTIETNSSIVRVIRDAVTKVRGGSITLHDAATPDDVTRWVMCTYDAGLTGTISFDFIDCAIDAGALAKFASAIMAKEPRFGSGAVPADRGSVFVKWTITIATGAADTAVTITDKDGGTAYSGTAEASGNYVVAIPQYETTGSQTIDWNAAGLSQTGWTFAYGGNPAQSFTANAAQTVSH